MTRYYVNENEYTQAALLGGSWTDWCEAGGSYFLADGQEDNALRTARRCLSEGVGKKDSETRLAGAHQNIASILEQRGVNEEALSHAKEAVAIDANNAFAFEVLARALVNRNRYQEAINAAKQAIRLSDGKYASQHFTMGSAYFAVERHCALFDSVTTATQRAGTRGEGPAPTTSRP